MTRGGEHRAAPLADVKARENSRWCETMLADREAAGKRRRGLDTARCEGRMEWRGRSHRPSGAAYLGGLGPAQPQQVGR